MKRYLYLILINIVVILLLVEAAFAVLYRNSLSSILLAHANREFYMSHERSIIQYDPQCARYDSTLGYRLMPPGCQFDGREFSTRVDVNSIGTRDTEQALSKPKIVFLGDSFAFGWGVQVSERYGSLVQQRAELPGLTVAVPSYGTARELLLLKEVDTSEMKTLVIQFCENDQDENISFVNAGGTLATMTADSYRDAARKNPANYSYFPGMYLRYFPAILWAGRPQPARLPSDQPARDKVTQLLKTLRLSPVSLAEVHKIIVFELNPFDLMDPHFARIMKSEIAKEPPDSVLKKIRVFDLSEALTMDDYYRYDDHLTAQGHKIVAEKILRELMDS